MLTCLEHPYHFFTRHIVAMTIMALAGLHLDTGSFVATASDTVPAGRKTVMQSADTALQRAITTGDLDRISVALSRQADPNTVDATGKSALMMAAKVGDHNLVHRLLEIGANPDASNRNGGTPLMFAAISGDPDTVDQLLQRQVNVNQRGSNGWGALMIAAAKGHLTTVKKLIAAGADVNTRDVYLWSPLHRAAYEDRLEVVKSLLATDSIDIHGRDDQGATALHHAASRGHSRIVAILLENGARNDITDTAERSPAYYADRQGYPKLGRLLRGSM